MLPHQPESPSANATVDSNSELGMELATQEQVKGDVESGGWDDLVGDLQEDEGFEDFDDEEVFIQVIT